MSVKLGNWAPSIAQATALSPSFSGTSRYDRMRSASQASSAVPDRPRLCRLAVASSPTLYDCRSISSRSLVSSFAPEIVRTRSATIGLPNRSVPAARTT